MPHIAKGDFFSASDIKLNLLRRGKLREVLTLNEAALLLDVSRHTLEKLCKQGRIEHAARIGTMWRINAKLEWPQMFGEEERDEHASGNGR